MNSALFCTIKYNPGLVTHLRGVTFPVSQTGLNSFLEESPISGHGLSINDKTVNETKLPVIGLATGLTD